MIGRPLRTGGNSLADQPVNVAQRTRREASDFVGGSTGSRLLAPSNSFPVSRSSSTVSNSKSKIGDAIVKLHPAQLGKSTVSTLKPSLQGSSFPPQKKKKKSQLWSGNRSPPGRAAIGKSQPVQLRRSLVMAMATARWHVRKIKINIRKIRLKS